MAEGIRDFKLGRLGLPTITDTLQEGVGDTLAVTGAGVALGERRPKKYGLELPVHGTGGDTDPYAVGNRMRRQVRSMMENARLRSEGLYMQLAPDTEQNGWVLLGGGQLAYADGGVALAQYTLQLDDAYRVGSLRTHRPARRVELYDRRLGTTPRDWLGQWFGTDYSGATALAITYLPVGATDTIGAQKVPVGYGTRAGLGGATPVVVGRTHGEVLNFEWAEAAMNGWDDVVVWERNGHADPPGGAAAAALGLRPRLLLRLDDAQAATVAADSSDYLNNGVYVGSPLYQAPSLLVGDTDASVGLDQANGIYVRVPDNNSLDIVGDLTVRMRYNPRSGLTGIQGLISKAATPVGARGWRWGYDPATGEMVVNLEPDGGLSLTATGNEITDATRVANTAGDGRAAPDSSFGIWEATTNLVTNGGFETNTTGWAANGVGTTITRDTAAFKFGTASLRVVTPGTVPGEGAFWVAGGAQAGVGPGRAGTASAWVLAPVGALMQLLLYARQGNTNLANVSAAFTGTGAWQRVSLTYPGPPALTDNFAMSVYTTSTPPAQAVTYWVDGAQIENGNTAAAVLTTSGNEITDATRAAAAALGTGASGQMSDGLLLDSSFGIRRAATNLFRRGQCDTTTDYALSAATTSAVDATVPPPFSTQSIKIVCDGSIGGQGITAITTTGLAAAAGVVGVGSLWFKGVAGQSYFATCDWNNTDASTTTGTTVIFNATGAWQLIVAPPTAVAVGKTGDQLRLRLRENGAARAETFWVAHPMMESGQAVVAPYVATSGGVTATHAAARVQAAFGSLNPTQGWFAIRMRMGFAAGTTFTANKRLMIWQNDANNRLMLYYSFAGAGGFSMYRQAAGVSTEAVKASPGFAAGDYITVIGYWDATKVYISYNGAAFISVANTTIPALVAANFDIGTDAGASNTALDSDVLWAAWGTGVLTDANAATIHAFGNTDPALTSTFPGTAVALWKADTAAYETPTSETGKLTPYVETNGATAARVAARVQAPASLLNNSRGWMAMRVRMGYPSTHPAARAFMALNDGTTANRIALVYSGNAWATRRVAASAGGNSAAIADAWVAGDIRTIVLRWDATTVALSNGGAFVSVANGNTPVVNNLDIGNEVVSGVPVNSDVLWFACGTGVLVDADVATIAALAAADTPGPYRLPGNATMVWTADTVSYELGTRWASSIGAAITPGQAAELAAVYSAAAGNVQFYRNGALLNTVGGLPNTLFANTRQLTVGKWEADA